mgnify:CR=1 FL=1
MGHVIGFKTIHLCAAEVLDKKLILLAFHILWAGGYILESQKSSVGVNIYVKTRAWCLFER